VGGWPRFRKKVREFKSSLNENGGKLEGETRLEKIKERRRGETRRTVVQVKSILDAGSL